MPHTQPGEYDPGLMAQSAADRNARDLTSLERRFEELRRNIAQRDSDTAGHIANLNQRLAEVSAHVTDLEQTVSRLRTMLMSMMEPQRLNRDEEHG